jgi:hypothetical protein
MVRTYEPEEPRYEKGDRVWVLGGGGVRKPGLVIGHYVDWDLYRIVYTVDLADQGPRAVEEWRLSFRKKGEEHWQNETPASENSRAERAEMLKAEAKPERADKRRR